MQATCKELGFYDSRYLWKSAGILFLNGCHQHHYRHLFDSIANALPLPSSTRISEEGPHNGIAEYRCHVSKKSPLNISQSNSVSEHGSSPSTDRLYCLVLTLRI